MAQMNAMAGMGAGTGPCKLAVNNLHPNITVSSLTHLSSHEIQKDPVSYDVPVVPLVSQAFQNAAHKVVESIHLQNGIVACGQAHTKDTHRTGRMLLAKHGGALTMARHINQVTATGVVL